MLPRCCTVLAVSILNRIQDTHIYIYYYNSLSIIYLYPKYSICLLSWERYSFLFIAIQPKSWQFRLYIMHATKSVRHFGCEVYLAMRLAFMFPVQCPRNSCWTKRFRAKYDCSSSSACPAMLLPRMGEIMFAVGYVK